VVVSPLFHRSRHFLLPPPLLLLLHPRLELWMHGYRSMQQWHDRCICEYITKG
jgi:hypothetical protein